MAFSGTTLPERRLRPILAVLQITAAMAGLPARAASQAPGTPVEVGRTLAFESRVLGETRTIDVALPASYSQTPGRSYPVLIVLDGESLFPVTSAMTHFYGASGELPEMIVVGIRNTARTRDMMPAPIEGFRPTGVGSDNPGGADRFLSFLADELLPSLDRDYRTAPMRTLVGHSASGLFVVYALATRPELFTGYLFMEAAVWWNNEHELRGARAVLATPAARRARVIQVNGPPLGGDTTAWGGSVPMVRFLRVEGTTHVGMPVEGIMRGLRTLFADFLPLSWRPGMRPIEMLARYDLLAARVGYAVPIPARTWELVARMSLDGRYFDDVEQVLARMPASNQREQLRARLAQERSLPTPPDFVPLVVSPTRPTPAAAKDFLGRWERADSASGSMDHQLEIRADGDTVVVYGRWRLASGDVNEDYRAVLQITPAGTLEWGLPVFIGLPAVLAVQGQVLPDGTLTVTTQARGWAPPPGSPESGPQSRTYRFRRVEP